MSGSLGIGIFVVAILVVILVHEAAHFGMAKLFRIKVEEFFIGFGPRLWSFRRGETEYGIKAIPAGGYVRIAGMNPYEEPTPEEYPRTFGAKPIWQRALVIFAGPATHFVIALFVLAAYFLFIGSPTRFAPVIDGVVARLNGAPSPARAAGLQPGDVVLSVDGIEHIACTPDGCNQLVNYTSQRAGQTLTMVVQRGDRRITLHVTPVRVKTQGQEVGRIGVEVGGGPILARDRPGLATAVATAGTDVGKTTVEVVKSLGRVFGPQGLGRIFDLLFGGAQRKATDVTSVVGVARAAGQATSSGAFDVLFLLLAGINVFVGVLNLIPLPPFDGGHLAVLAVEKVRGKKVDMRKLVPLTAVVAAFLVLFMVSVLYLDIFKPLPNLFR
ncbi:MAG: RIP metalloprotease [Actinomycetota bacterium]|nr:RIP metalloprotease [Actinomycetota bacterium]